MRTAAVVVLLLLCAIPALAAIPSSERQALLDLYDATGGSSWSTQTGWAGSAGTECDWAGVQCDDAGAHVIEISLPANNLTGELPASLGLLTELEVLYLAGNQIGGSIPSGLRQLSDLRVLGLGSNQLTGDFPQWIGELSSLEELELQENQLGGTLPAGIGSLTSLRTLTLYQNQIEGSIPESIGDLTSLEYLALASNQFSGPIPDLGALQSLEILALDGNALSGAIPASLGELSALTVLQISSNQLSGAIPASLGQLVSLQALNLAYNQLAGPIPQELGSLPNLVDLHLQANQLSGTIPSSLASLQSLATLDLSYNSLTGTIPAALSSLPSLTALRLSGNALTGAIPSSLSDLATLEELELGSNALTGTLPPAIATLVMLRRLEISHNDLSGPLPDLSSLQRLESLDVGGNDIGGPIPEWIYSLSELRHLGIEESGMTGALSHQLRQLQHLEELYAWGNEFEGTISEWIGDLTNLRLLLLGGNRLTGEIPRSVTRLTNLTTLDLQGNVHTGTIPDDIGALTQLEYLSLGENALSGAIPSSFSSLKKLIDVRLDRNELTGELPSLEGFDALEVLLLDVNRLSGPFPEQLYDAPKLYLASLGSNQFSGALPPSIVALSNLEYLDISQNAFVGQIPRAFLELDRLSGGSLRVSYNALDAADSEVRAFIDARDELGAAWRATQTLPPTSVSTSNVTDRSVVVQWTPIDYIYDGGGYRISASLTPSGDPVAIAAVSEKESDSAILRGLQADTTYYVRVSSFTSPNGYQRNLVVSMPTTAVSVRTGPPALSPADVAVTKTPAGIVQIGGVTQNTGELVLKNFGDVATVVTLARVDGTFFEIVPASVDLAPGESETVEVRVITAQPAGGYWGTIGLSGAGVPPDTFVSVELLSVATPSGTVEAEASASRIDLSGAVDSTSVGTVSFRNRGNAELTGVLASDVPWIDVPLALVRIQPGEEGMVTFSVDRSRRPTDERLGAATGTLALVYVDGSGTTVSSLSGIAPFNNLPPGVSATKVKVVDTAGASSPAGAIPSLMSGEIARFVPGLRSIEIGDGSQVSDVTIANATGVRPIEDLRLYFHPFAGNDDRVATFDSLSPAAAVMLANVAESVYSATEGSLQIRSPQWDRLASSAMLHLRGESRIPALAAHPVYRSDRAASPGDRVVITGVQLDDGVSSLIVQETSGQDARVRIQTLRPNGTEARAARTLDVGAWSSVVARDAITSDTATVVISHEEGSAGSVVAVVAIDDAAGDVWMLPDWSRVHGFDPSTGSRLAWIERSAGHTPRRRGVRRGSLGANATGGEPGTVISQLWLFNEGDEPAAGELIWFPSSGSPRRTTVTLQPKQTLHYPDVIKDELNTSTGAGSLVWAPVRGTVHMQARTMRSDERGSVVPALRREIGLRLGESRNFTGVEDSTAESEGTEGALRSEIVLQEVAGERARVRLTIRLASARSLTSTAISREVELSPGESRNLGPAGLAVLGGTRGDYGDLHNIQLDVRVIEGSGAVLPLLRVIETSAGDVAIRVE